MSFKRFLMTVVTVLLVFTCLFSLVACGDGFYDPIKSSKQDRRVIAEMYDDKVKYELFRYIFMSRINDYDGGDRSLWSGESADALWKKAQADVMDEICEIYAVFAVCRKWGIDPDGDNIDDAVNRNIVLDIDGGVLSDGTIVIGDGSVDAYKKHLKEIYCTDAVRRLLYKYKACLEALDSYIVDNHAKGKEEASVTDDELLAFATGGQCAHINRVYISFEQFSGYEDLALELAQKQYNKLLAANGDYATMAKEVFTDMQNGTGSDAGVWYGRFSSSARDYPAYYNAIFSTQPGQLSEIIREWDGYYIVYAIDSAVDLEDKLTRSSLTSLYLEELYWGQIRETARILEASIKYTEHFGEMTPLSLMEDH